MLTGNKYINKLREIEIEFHLFICEIWRISLICWISMRSMWSLCMNRWVNIKDIHRMRKRIKIIINLASVHCQTFSHISRYLILIFFMNHIFHISSSSFYDVLTLHSFESAGYISDECESGEGNATQWKRIFNYLLHSVFKWAKW